MTPESAVEILKLLIFQAVVLAAPLLVVAMVVGLGVSLFQTVTSINEQTLSFVPKAGSVLAALVILLPWMLRTLTEFAQAVIQKMPDMVR
jgi:flagellar biosynthesis protein FliQ